MQWPQNRPPQPPPLDEDGNEEDDYKDDTKWVDQEDLEPADPKVTSKVKWNDTDYYLMSRKTK
ncbi:MAG: hypothetical protein ABF337_07350, partial [Akkermansiaceae bacterium]